MAEVIAMPRLSDTMTEGVIAAWHKKIGDTVKKGELLAEIETDKATMELDSYRDGTLLHIGAEPGGKIQVDDLLCIIGQPGEDIAALISVKGAAAKPEAAASPAAAPAPAASPAPTATASATAPALDISKMEEVVLMPRLSDTMTEGVIAVWHKQVGEDVKKGDVLADIETDKATMELESYKNGKLLHQGAAAGQKIQVNDLLCVIGEEGKVDVAGIVAASQGGTTPPPAAAVEAQPASAEATVAPAPQPVATEAATAEAPADGRIKASPLAKRLAKEKGIEIAQVRGSGDGGRIVKSDVDAFTPGAAATTTAQAQPAAATAAPAGAKTSPATQVSSAPAGTESHYDTPVSQMRKVIAKRLSESMFGAPHFYLGMEINMDGAMAARAVLNEGREVKISFNDLVIKAAAMALKQHPAVNSSWLGDTVRTYHHVHIGVAVAIEDGLIVPVVKFADTKGLGAIATEVKELAGKARAKKLQPAEFSGNTFTISNLGMMDIEEFTAIINPPDSAILAVGRIKEVVVRKGDGFGVTNVMKVTLSCDHRSVDGAVGAAFLQTFKKLLENPVAMLG